MKPACFDRIENNEIREVIENCTRLNRTERPKAKELVQHPFFAEDVGLRIETIKQSPDGKVILRLRFIDPKKRTNKYKENEAIQFDFDIHADLYESVSEEMVC